MRSHRRAATEPRSRVMRAAEKAQRAQEGPGIIGELVNEKPDSRDRCVYCGGPSPKRDGVCVGHRDLGAAIE